MPALSLTSTPGLKRANATLVSVHHVPIRARALAAARFFSLRTHSQRATRRLVTISGHSQSRVARLSRLAMGYFWDPTKPDEGRPQHHTDSLPCSSALAFFIVASIFFNFYSVHCFSQFLPYMLRVNDDPEYRKRRFYREFQNRQDPQIPEEWINTPEDIILKERMGQ